jgi:drug/metabolite transporter (DMT)-like permease
MRKQELAGMLCLLLTALIWGFAFVAQVQGMDSMSPLFFNAARFTLGALSLVPILLWRRRGSRGSQGSERRSSKAGRSRASKTAESVLSDGSVHSNESAHLEPAAIAAERTGNPAQRTASHLTAALGNPIIVSVICGVVLFAASTLQQYGISYGKSAGRAGFLTALYIVMVPLLAFVFLRRRIGLMVGVAVALAVVGFYLLCITDGFGSLGLADLLLLFTAVLFAAHILVIDTLGTKIDAIQLSFGQFCTTAALSWIGALAEGSVDWSGAAHSWIPILYAGIGSVGIAYTLQVVGQQWVPPTRASLLMSLESFFSVIGGAIFLGEVMTPRGYCGCALIFIGTLLAQAPNKMPKLPHRAKSRKPQKS